MNKNEYIYCSNSGNDLTLIVIFYLIIYNNSLKLEKRIAKYSISSIKDDSISFFDLLANEYKKDGCKTN